MLNATFSETTNIIQDGKTRPNTDLCRSEKGVNSAALDGNRMLDATYKTIQAFQNQNREIWWFKEVGWRIPCARLRAERAKAPPLSFLSKINDGAARIIMDGRPRYQASPAASSAGEAMLRGLAECCRQRQRAANLQSGK